MKLLREMVTKGVLLRNTLGKTVSATGMVTVLNKLFDSNFTIQDVVPYVRSLNQALKSAQTEEQAEQVWHRLHSELVHRNKRAIPSE